MPFAAEEADADYQRGKQLIRQGRNQEALEAFLKVVARRGDDAPESHLEAGLLLQQHIKDPIEAIHHFRKFLELQPNSKQADLVRQRIEAAKREFARTLPANPMEDARVKLEISDRLDRLQRENEQLKAELVALRGGLAATPAPMRQSSGFDIPIVEPSSSPPPRPVQVEPSSEEGSPVIRPQFNANAEPVRVSPGARSSTAAKPTPPAAASGKRHVVRQGDTLSNLSRQYYGTSAKWREIYNANRDVLKSENETLRLGMEIKIP